MCDQVLKKYISTEIYDFWLESENAEIDNLNAKYGGT